MPAHLERDLGLYATITISIGAMIGSGIFVLPGKAAEIAGPSAVLAYLLAGLVVLPAALSKAEMATAMPEAGGTYLFIDRAMGPLPGTIAGIGAWFSLVFKSAFALVGLGAYLLLFVDVSEAVLPAVALGLAVLLLVVNVVGVEQTGRLQAGIVTFVLLALVAFVADGLTFVDGSRFHPFFEGGGNGLLEATGFVFVSYAGVTKVASVAEEVEDPGRNIPLGILVSVVTMMVVYTLVVYVVVGVTPPAVLTAGVTPMAVAAREFAGGVGEAAVAAVAVLALTSMANAGILSSTRYPLAMSRDALAPAGLSRVSERFGTPVQSIAFSGAVLLALVAFVPVVSLAKLASAFQILVFSLVNVALVAFRESDLDTYDPSFVAPGYPWVQLFGLLAGVVLLTRMGPLPLAGAVGIVLAGAAWYRLYGRERTEREGAALDAVRRRTGGYSVDAVDRLFTTGGDGGTLLALGPGGTVPLDGTALRVAGSLTKRRGGRLRVTRFEHVPDQVTLGSAAESVPEGRKRLDPAAEERGVELGVEVEADLVVSHELRQTVANYAARTGVGTVVGEYELERFRGELLGTDVDWYMEHVPADLVFVRDRGLDGVGTVAVVTDRGPYDPLQVVLADALATDLDATVRFVYVIDPDASDEEVDALRTYHGALTDRCTARATVDLVRGEDREAALLAAAGECDLTVASTSAHHVLYDVVFGSIPDRLARDLDVTVVLVHSHRSRSRTFLRYLLERLAF